MTFFSELKRRNVFKVAAAYGAVTWMFLELSALALNAFSAPSWVMKVLIFLVVAGFIAAVLLSWAFEMTPQGLASTQRANETQTPDVTQDKSFWDTSEPASAGNTPTSDNTQAVKVAVSRKLNFITISALSVLLLVVVLDSYVFTDAPDAGVSNAGQVASTPDGETAQSPSANDTAVSTASAPTPQAETSQTTEKSLAVLPFSNLSAEPDQEYFSDGLTEELINTLSRVDDLLVTGRASAFYFKNSEMPMQEIAQNLGVEHLLQGSVRKAGTQLRIAVQLTEAASGFNLWSETYDRQLDDIFVVQQEIAVAVTTALSVALGAGAFAEPGMTRNVEAYDEYLRAQQAQGIGTDEKLQEAIIHAERAVALDPGFALGWYRVASTYRYVSSLLSGTETEGYRARMAAALQKAESLVPNSSAGLTIKLTRLEFEKNWLEAEQVLQQMLALNGDNAALNYEYAFFLAYVGRMEESLQYMRRARRQEPLSSTYAFYLAEAMLNARVPVAESREQFSEALVLNDGPAPALYSNLALVEMEEQNWDLALAATQKTEAVREVQTRLLTYLMEGRIEEGLADIRSQMEDPALQPVFENKHLPVFAALYGDTDLVIELFTNAGNMDTVVWTDIFSEVRRHPGFKTLVEKLGQLDYWRSTGNWGDHCRPVGDDFECF